MTNNKNLINHYLFYEKHHKNKLNILVHMLCIPVLVWTYAFFLTYIPFEYSFKINSFYLNPLVFNFTSIMSILYVLYYIYLDFRIGRLSFFLFFLVCYTTKLCKILYPENSLYYCILLHLTSWVLQILSHKYFEGNRPAFVTGLIQSFTIAPFFTILEFCFIFGLRPDIYSAIQERKCKDKVMDSYQLKNK